MPKYPWTDLAYSLLLNGHGDAYESAALGDPTTGLGNPIGVDKQSYRFSISGWTDDLFPPVESFRQFKQLKRAQNVPQVWRNLNSHAWQFLSDQIANSHREQTAVFSFPAQCAPGSEPASSAVVAHSSEDLAKGHLTVDYAAARLLTSDAGLADPNGPATVPLAHATSLASTDSPCVNFTRPSDRRIHWRFLPGRESDIRRPGLRGGAIRLHRPDWSVGCSAVGRCPIWPGAARLSRPFFGNHWQFASAHRMRLDLTQVDQPFPRPSNPTSTLSFATPCLVLPTREASDLVLTGS